MIKASCRCCLMIINELVNGLVNLCGYLWRWWQVIRVVVGGGDDGDSVRERGERGWGLGFIEKKCFYTSPCHLSKNDHISIKKLT